LGCLAVVHLFRAVEGQNAVRRSDYQVPRDSKSRFGAVGFDCFAAAKTPNYLGL
jgi:hypothetical protein